MDYYRVYQLVVRSDVPLPAPRIAAAAAELKFVRAAPGAPRPFEPNQATCVYGRSGAVEFHCCGAWSLLQYGAADFFLRPPRLVVCYPREDAAPELLASLLLGAVCAVMLELRGSVCLHAAAVELDGQAVAFLGRSGAGKSSLAAALVQAGCRLLTDDILPVTLAADQCLAVPGFPQIKLRADAAESLLESEAARSRAVPSPSLGKHCLAVDDGRTRFADRPLPLRGVYLLHRADRADIPPVVEPLPPSQRYLSLLGHSFCACVIGPLELERQRFGALAEIARRTTIGRLVLPNRLDGLRAAREALRRDGELDRERRPER